MYPCTVPEKYLAKEAGLLPTGDDVQVAQAESVYQFLFEILKPILETTVRKEPCKCTAHANGTQKIPHTC